MLDKPLEELTYSDVVAFLKEEEIESEILDYKEDVSGKTLARTIAAFANTMGGTVVLGVADDGAKPNPLSTGMPAHDKREEQIWSIVVDRIRPPVSSMSVRRCVDDAGAREFVVLAIPESHEGPHAVAEGRRIYVRTGNRNDYEELASLGRIEWLLNRRKKATDLRVELRKGAERRADRWAQYARRPFEKLPRLHVWAAPTYPHQPLAASRQCKEVVDGWRSRFPPSHFPEFMDLAPVPCGARWVSSIEERKQAYGEFSQWGTLYFTRGLVSEIRGDEEGDHLVVHLREIADSIAACLLIAKEGLTSLVYRGVVRIVVEVTHFDGVMTFVPGARDSYRPPPDSAVFAARSVAVRDIELDCFRRILEEVSWSFGFDLPTIAASAEQIWTELSARIYPPA